MNEVRPQPPCVTPLRRAWLREIGIDRIWGDVEHPAAAAAAASGAVSRAAGQALGTNPGGGRSAVPTAPTAADKSVLAQAGAGAPRVRPDVATAGRALAHGLSDAESASPSASPSDASSDALVGPGATEAFNGRASASPPTRPGPDTTGIGATSQAPMPGPGAGADVPLSQLDMQALNERVAVCTACGLCQNRRNAVFGTGAAVARWMVIGEAPGEQEDRQGLPFVGKSGQLLDAMLGAVGMSRDADVFIANVIKCRPPANRNPKPEEIAACAPFLLRQIELVNPEGILVLGRFAAQTLLATDAPLGALRGRVHRLQSGGRDIPVVVSYHPAYLLRSPAEKARSWQDLRLAAAALTAASGLPPG